MRHLTAAQKGEGGGWHYVNRGREGGHPIGYCPEHEPHATEAEARECFAKYQRDHVRLDGNLSSWSDCMHGRTTDPKTTVRCPNPTKQYAYIEGEGYASFPACPEHLTLENAIIGLHLEGHAGDSWQS
jgi:hypothetical protein